MIILEKICAEPRLDISDNDDLYKMYEDISMKKNNKSDK